MVSKLTQFCPLRMVQAHTVTGPFGLPDVPLIRVSGGRVAGL